MLCAGWNGLLYKKNCYRHNKRQDGREYNTYVFRLGQKDYLPDELITDNGPEFNNEKLKKWCPRMGITHTRVGVEAHGCNGRVKRVVKRLKNDLGK